MTGVQTCALPIYPMNCSTPGLPVHHQLPEFTQTHVHRVGDAIQPSHPLSSSSPPAPNPSQHQTKLGRWWDPSWAISNPKRWCCESAALYASKFGKLSSGHRMEKISFHSNPKERQCQECSNYHTVVLISHASKVMFKILQARFQQYVNQEFPDV